ncbi:hypothetical protein FRB95_001730 [Tulasnella sp. JGI-2019a]|nr:hypothetical protein FRB95_001730 [Tulasnella sp. JGI-2019a]
MLNIPIVKPEPVDQTIEQRVFQDLSSHLSPTKVKAEPPVKSEAPVSKPGTPVKREPQAELLTPSRALTLASTSNASPFNSPRARVVGATPTRVKPESHDGATGTPKHLPVVQSPYVKYDNANAIEYTPEAALSSGKAMIDVIKERIRTLEIGSKLRKEVWKKDLDGLCAQTTPTTLIAICGATGAGKSSVINAILDDSIVPTSGMRACTAVVTEISYKKGPSIMADVSFLTKDEWKAELDVLLTDLLDEDGRPRKVTDMRSEAGVAWSKVHAVYPNIPQDYLANLTADQILDRDPVIKNLLGTTKQISSANSKDFKKAIGKYIDSKEKKRGNKDDKEKKKDKTEGPALWPLIRTVRVRCSAKALSTGAILVDLPGTADSNAARSSIAQQYMQRCQCIWILAPITRAVDDKVAKDLLGEAFKTQLLMDGNYDTSTVSFIATKTDDISCNEIITALNLEDDPGLQEIEEKTNELHREERRQKKVKSGAEDEAKVIGPKLKELRAIVLEYKAHIRALKRGEPFQQTVTKNLKRNKRGSSNSGKDKVGNKRKSIDGDSPKAKRRKSSLGSDDDDEDVEDLVGFIVDDDDDSMKSDSDSDNEGSNKSNGYKDSDDEKSEKADSDGEDAAMIVEELREDDEMEEEVTVETIKAKLEPLSEELKKLKKDLEDKKQEGKDAGKELMSLKKKLNRAQRDKNGFCAKARNEYSRESLKEDWRSGIKEMDQEAAQQRDPDNFDPSVDQRDYSLIDLPTFTVSSRDYIRLSGQVEGDGEPTCFSDKEDTQIPAVQVWCHQLTVSSRERTARSFLQQLKTFLANVQSALHHMSTVSEADRTTLRERWASETEHKTTPAVGRGETPALQDIYGRALNNLLYYGYDDSEEEEDYPPEPSRSPAPVNEDGVAPSLKQMFRETVDSTVLQLQDIFRAGLEDKLQQGSANAAAAALETSDNFAAAIHWATYRATLRRDGVFCTDLNAEMCFPMTKSIAQSWAQVFEQNLFADFEKRTTNSVQDIIFEIKETAPYGLKDQCGTQGELAIKEANVAMKQIVAVVANALQKEQKEVSRCLAPHIQAQLRPGYQTAMLERGTGSVKRQKTYFHNFIEGERDTLFSGGSTVLMERLAQAAESIGNALDASLSDLARKVEVAMAVLWESAPSNESQIAVRAKAAEQLTEVLHVRRFVICFSTVILKPTSRSISKWTCGLEQRSPVLVEACLPPPFDGGLCRPLTWAGSLRSKLVGVFLSLLSRNALGSTSDCYLPHSHVGIVFIVF